MTKDTISGYDVVDYPSGLYDQTHPDRLATVARLFGLEAPPVDTARVLELGCGDGLNLISLGHILPNAQMLGVDLAEKPIARGNAIVSQAQISNVTLQAADVLALGDSLGTFDYIIAHGLYSWVPAEVRDGILALCEKHLSPNGVAYISYNAHPGNHFRDLARGMMRFHTQQFEDSETSIAQARSILKFVVDSQPNPDLYRLVIERQLKRVTEYNDNSFFHDDLSEENHPVYFYQFVEHAEQHGLQYLGEADFGDMREDGYSPKTSTMLRQLGGNLIAREQYLDLLRNRAFRQTLICREEVPLNRSIPPGQVMSLCAAANVSIPDETDHSKGFTCFSGPKGEIETGHPLGKFALSYLGSRWPEAVPFEDLIAKATEHFEPTGDSIEDEDRTSLATLLLRAYEAGPVTLHTIPPPCTSAVTERPKASHLARTLVARSDAVPTLRHQTMRLGDPPSRYLLRLLDGTRACEQVRDELMAFIRQTNDQEADLDATQFDAKFVESLQSLARTAILEDPRRG